MGVLDSVCQGRKDRPRVILFRLMAAGRVFPISPFASVPQYTGPGNLVIGPMSRTSSAKYLATAYSRNSFTPHHYFCHAHRRKLELAKRVDVIAKL